MDAPGALPGEEGVWRLRSLSLPLRQPLVMGVLNLTPDSFSDGGRFDEPSAALHRAVELVAEGADILDVGGESTRPGAAAVPVELEIARVVPVVRRLKAELPVPISVDTRKAEVARAALEAGAEIVNDVSALGDPAMAEVVAQAGAGLALMHMRGTPATMQHEPRYADVAAEVTAELEASLARALDAGVRAERIVLDPGIGFAKSFDHNLEMIARLEVLGRLGRPVLLGPSRKGFLGALLDGRPAAERGAATAAACVVGLLNGARIFRVHDVRMVRDALVVAEAIRRAGPEKGRAA